MCKCLYCYKELEEGQKDLTSGRVSSRSAISSELDGSRLIGAFFRFFLGFSSSITIRLCLGGKDTKKEKHLPPTMYGYVGGITW